MEPEEKTKIIIFTLLIAIFFTVGGYTTFNVFQETKSFFFAGLYLAVAYVSSKFFGIVPFVLITALVNLILLMI